MVIHISTANLRNIDKNCKHCQRLESRILAFDCHIGHLTLIHCNGQAQGQAQGHAHFECE